MVAVNSERRVPARRAEPLLGYAFHSGAFSLRYADAFSVEPVFAFVASNHELVVMRLMADAPGDGGKTRRSTVCRWFFSGDNFSYQSDGVDFFCSFRYEPQLFRVVVRVTLFIFSRSFVAHLGAGGVRRAALAIFGFRGFLSRSSQSAVARSLQPGLPRRSLGFSRERALYKGEGSR